MSSKRQFDIVCLVREKNFEMCKGKCMSAIVHISNGGPGIIELVFNPNVHR